MGFLFGYVKAVRISLKFNQAVRFLVCFAGSLENPGLQIFKKYSEVCSSIGAILFSVASVSFIDHLNLVE